MNTEVSMEMDIIYNWIEKDWYKFDKEEPSQHTVNLLISSIRDHRSTVTQKILRAYNVPPHLEVKQALAYILLLKDVS